MALDWDSLGFKKFRLKLDHNQNLDSLIYFTLKQLINEHEIRDFISDWWLVIDSDGWSRLDLGNKALIYGFDEVSDPTDIVFLIYHEFGHLLDAQKGYLKSSGAGGIYWKDKEYHSLNYLLLPHKEYVKLPFELSANSFAVSQMIENDIPKHKDLVISYESGKEYLLLLDTMKELKKLAEEYPCQIMV